VDAAAGRWFVSVAGGYNDEIDVSGLRPASGTKCECRRNASEPIMKNTGGPR